MTTKIFKYELPVVDAFTLTLPHGAELLQVQVQHGRPCLWARVDPTARPETRRFRIFGTGHELPDGAAWSGSYLGTFQQAGGDLVWHLFEDET